MHDACLVESAVVDAIVAGSATFGSLTDAEVLVALDELGARRRALDAALVEAAGEIAARSDGMPAEESLARKGGQRSPAQLLQHRIGMRAREARQVCAVADATRERRSLTGAVIPPAFPHVAAALSRGRLSIAQAHAITAGLDPARGRAGLDALEQAETLLVAAGCGTAAHDDAPALPETLASLATACLAYVDPDGDEPRFDERLARRSLTLHRRSDGSVVGRLVCTAEQGEILQAALDAHVRPHRPTFDDACGTPDDEADAADARTIEQRRLDALVALVAIVGRHAETTAPRIVGEAPVLTVIVSEAALHGRRDRLDDVPRLERSGDAVPTSVAARMLCDAFVQPVVQDAHGEPLRLGRRRRLFSRSQRRAIVARDRRCRAPGCTAPAGWCETHHVARWADGGTTDAENGILLCRHDHTEVHRGVLRIAPAATGRWRVAAVHPPRPRTAAARRA
jgi:hypothetical protein